MSTVEHRERNSSRGVRARVGAVGRLAYAVGTAVTLAALSGCASSFLDDLDLASFEQAPIFDQGFRLSRLQPAQPFDYVELRRERYSTVLAQHGELCVKATDRAACEAEFRALRSETSFGRCGAVDCAAYYAVNRGGVNSTAGSRDELLVFFGTIDAPEEALSLAHADGYHWGWAKEDGAYRQTDLGFELIVLRVTSSCDPVEIKRYLLRVRRDGSTEVLEHEVKESESGCI